MEVIDQVLVPPRVDVDEFFQTCGRNGNGNGGNGHYNGCSYLGVQRSAGQTLVGPTHTCLCTHGGGWTQCRLNHHESGGSSSSLVDILLYHVASGETFSTDLSNRQQIPTLLQGAEVTVRLNNNGVKINESKVLTADVRASNGVIHIIDQVLVPPRIDVEAFLRTCRTSNNGGGIRGNGSHNNNNNHRNTTCYYLGMQRSAGQYLVGTTHTCLCTSSGAWTQCRRNNHW